MRGSRNPISPDLRSRFARNRAEWNINTAVSYSASVRQSSTPWRIQQRVCVCVCVWEREMCSVDLVKLVIWTVLRSADVLCIFLCSWRRFKPHGFKHTHTHTHTHTHSGLLVRLVLILVNFKLNAQCISLLWNSESLRAQVTDPETDHKQH